MDNIKWLRAGIGAKAPVPQGFHLAHAHLVCLPDARIALNSPDEPVCPHVQRLFDGAMNVAQLKRFHQPQHLHIFAFALLSGAHALPGRR